MNTAYQSIIESDIDGELRGEWRMEKKIKMSINGSKDVKKGNNICTFIMACLANK